MFKIVALSMIADASYRPVVAGPVEAGCENLLVQILAENGKLDLRSVRSVVRDSFDPITYEPQNVGWNDSASVIVDSCFLKNYEPCVPQRLLQHLGYQAMIPAVIIATVPMATTSHWYAARSVCSSEYSTLVVKSATNRALH